MGKKVTNRKCRRLQLIVTAHMLWHFAIHIDRIKQSTLIQKNKQEKRCLKMANQKELSLYPQW